MTLLRRISDLLRSNINDLISRAEDPEKMLNAAIEEMQKQLVEAKSRVAMSIADEKRLEKHHLQEKNKADEWERKAMSAVQAGRDDLAMEALNRKKEHADAAAQYAAQLEQQRGAVDELKRALGDLTSKLDETKRKRTLLLARAKRAEAQRRLAETLTNRSQFSALERLERLESRVEREEARAEASWELNTLDSGGYEHDLASEIDALESPEPSDELAALKARMAQSLPEPQSQTESSSRGALSAPKSDADPAAEAASPEAEATSESESDSGAEPGASGGSDPGSAGDDNSSEPPKGPPTAQNAS